LGVHWDSNSQSGSSFENMEVHSLTLSHAPRSMKCESQLSHLACTFASPYLGHKPKARVLIIIVRCNINEKWLGNML